MPLYEFRCLNGHDFEKFYRSIGAAPSEEKCPGCGALAARLMSPAGLVFKGSGFYITDYGKDGKKAEREAATAKEASKADAAKPDASKPDVKAGETPAKASDAPAPATTPKPAASSASDAAPAKSSTASKPKSE